MELARTLSPSSPFNSKHIMAFSSPSLLDAPDDDHGKQSTDFTQASSPRMPVPSALTGLPLSFDDQGFNIQEASTKMYGGQTASGMPAARAAYPGSYPDPAMGPSAVPRGYGHNLYIDQGERSYMQPYDSSPSYSPAPSLAYSSSSASSNMDPVTPYPYSYPSNSHGYSQPHLSYHQPHYAPYPARRQSTTSTSEMMVHPSSYPSSSQHYLEGPHRRSLTDIPRDGLVHRHGASSGPTRSESGSPHTAYVVAKPGGDPTGLTGNPNRPLYTHREQLSFFKDAILNCPMASEAGPFIPQTMYKPHTTSDRRRYVEEVDLEAPIYFWVNHPTECGIPLSDALHSRVKRLQNRDECVFEGRGPSVSIRLEWPGYRQWSRQIPTKDFRSPPGPITRAKLAKNVAKCVQRFISERANHPEPDGDARFRIGNSPNQIKLDDLILVSIHHVSMGSWQPQLRLRRPFHTPASTPPLANSSPPIPSPGAAPSV